MTARLIGRIAAQPWAILPEALETILDVAAREPVDEANLAAWKDRMAPRALATRRGPAALNTERTTVRDGVAIVPVSGPIFRYANMMTDFSGATSLASLAQDLAVVGADARVKAILLEIDSPGGETTGMTEAAAQIRALARQKPVVAYVEGLAGSAAYLLASAAGEIVMASMAVAGGLGVVQPIVDRRAADARAGIVRREIVSSQTPGKRPDAATDSGLAAYQAVVDRLATEFLTEVADSRGMTVEALLAATNGGGVLVGSDAVAAGLADSVGSFEGTLAALVAGTSAPLRSLHPAPRAQQEAPMPTDPVPTPPIAAAAAPVAQPEPPTPPVAAVQPPAALDGVAVERARCAAIQAAMQPGFAALASLAVTEGWSAEVFAQAQTASAGAVDTARREGAGASFRASLPDPLKPSGDAVDPATLPPAERAKAEFAADAKLKAEFGSEGAYVAYVEAVAAGKVRAIGRKA